MVVCFLKSTIMHNIVFLDRDSLIATVRPPAFAHSWRDHGATAPHEVVERLRGASVAITNKVPLRAPEIAQLPDLKLVAVAATGTDNVDLAACRERGIAVCNIRDYSVVSVPEHCFALMLAVRRNLLAYAADVAAGRWEKSTRFCLLDHPIGDLAGSRLGIVGYGALGRRVAQIGRAFGMEIGVSSRSKVADRDVVQLPLPELLATSDVITLHLPLTDQTRHMIGAAELAAMKKKRHPDQHRARRPGRRGGAGRGAYERRHRRRRLRRPEQGAAGARQPTPDTEAAEFRADPARGLGQRRRHAAACRYAGR
jgi:glycerate dehydrogenase